MPVELATLGLRLTNAQAIADARATGAAFEEMGVKGEAAARKLTLSSSPVTEAIKKQEVASISATRGMSAWSAMQAEAAGHVGSHSLAIGQIERRMASALEPMLGLNRVTGTLSASLLKFGIGSVETVGVLAGIYAITYAWNKFTEEAEKAAKAQDALVVKLNAAILSHVQGPGGETADMITAGYGRISDIGDEQKAVNHWWSRDLNPSTRADKSDEQEKEIGLLRLAIKSAETDLQLANAKQFAGSVSTPYDRALSRGTSLDGFYSQALAAEGKLSELAKSGTYEVRDAALQAMGTMEKILNHIKLVRIGLAEAPKQILGLESGVAVGGLGQTTSNLQAAIASGATHGRDISAFVDQIDTLGNMLSQASNQATGADKTKIQGFFDSVQILTDAVNMGAATSPAAREAIAATVRSRASTHGTPGLGDLANVEAQKKYGETLAQREAALKLPAVFDVVREAALKLGEGLRTSHERLGGVLQEFKPGNIPSGAASGAMNGVSSALEQFTPGAIAYSAVTSGINYIVSGFTDMATSMLDGGAAAREYARAQRQMRDEYAAAVAQFKHDDLGALLASNAATFEQLMKQAQDTLLNVGTIIRQGAAGADEYKNAIADLAKQQALNAAMIQKQAAEQQQYSQEDLVVRNLRAIGQGSQADQLAFRESQQREYQAAVDKAMADGVVTAAEQTYLNTLATTQNNELLAFLNGTLTDAARNTPSGFYGIASYAGAFVTPRTQDGYTTDGGIVRPPVQSLPSGTTNLPPPRPLHITLRLADGRVLTQVVVSSLDQQAAATNGAGSSRAQALETFK